jgi:hypothetical protein
MAVAMLCALLIVFAGVVQVAHAHPGSAAVHADCSLCVAVHISLHPTHDTVQPPVARVVRRVEVTSILRGASALVTFALFTRPPPIAAVAA